MRSAVGNRFDMTMLQQGKITIILNPKAGRQNKTAVLNKCINAFPHIEILKTEQRGDAMRLAEQTDANIVLAAGGDGTVNEVINGILRNKKKNIVLGILPLGTSNLCAKSLGMPLVPMLNTKELIRGIIEKKTRRIDIGKINDRYFVIACGVGMDAEMYKNVEPNIKRFFGEVAYPISLLKTMFSHQFKTLEITIIHNNDVTTIRGYYALICNMGKYTRLFQVIPEAKDDDGLLDILVFKNKDLFSQFVYLFNLISKTQNFNKDIAHIQGHKFFIKPINNNEKVYAHADAEIVGTTPVNVSILPKALEVIVG